MRYGSGELKSQEGGKVAGIFRRAKAYDDNELSRLGEGTGADAEALDEVNHILYLAKQLLVTRTVKSVILPVAYLLKGHCLLTSQRPAASLYCTFANSAPFHFVPPLNYHRGASRVPSKIVKSACTRSRRLLILRTAFGVPLRLTIVAMSDQLKEIAEWVS